MEVFFLSLPETDGPEDPDRALSCSLCLKGYKTDRISEWLYTGIVKTDIPLLSKGQPSQPPRLYKLTKENQELVPDLGQFPLKLSSRHLQDLVGYERAIALVESSLVSIRKNLETLSGRTVVRSSTSRIKSSRSIREKLERMHLPVSYQSMKENLYDVAGVRVVVSYLDDIYRVLNCLKEDKRFTIIQIEDYVHHPKPSGYRSFHCVVLVPLIFPHEQRALPVEIQLRTTSMDGWASLEHQLRYKKAHVLNETTSRQLTECSRMLYETDCLLQSILDQVELLEKPKMPAGVTWDTEFDDIASLNNEKDG